jgi:solute carrier family 13 (sodium-dependent dicarboxylate transporter), member 2/3/5
LILNKKNLGLLLGPLAFVFLNYFLDTPGLTPQARSVLASIVWMAIWWVTEALPIPVTALLPIVLFPLSGSMSLKDTTTPYSHPLIYLYLGGFLIAIAIEKVNLHKRFALLIIKMVGTQLVWVIFGFMLATAFLSMWISNTASAVMILPVGLAIITQLRDNPHTTAQEDKAFGKALMLSIAYSASIGGMATLIGTPPNLIMAGIVRESLGMSISFSQWFVFAFPLTLVFLLAAWYYLTHRAFGLGKRSFPGGKEEIQRQIDLLGPLTLSEKKVAWVFGLTALAWITKSYFLHRWIPYLDDTIIAIIGGMSLFILPGEEKGQGLLVWEDALALPWGIVLLFGGGLSLAAAVEQSGLALWLGGHLSIFFGLGLLILLVVVVTFVNFLTEITSNMAVTAMLIPVLITAAAVAGFSPYYFVVGATLAASCAFMMPISTPPNAVVFGSGYLTIKEMAQTGLWLNLLAVLLISLMVYFVLPVLWNFS